MKTSEEIRQELDRSLGFLLHGPALRTRAGCRARVAALSLGERWRLAHHFACDVDQIDKRLHDLNHKKRIRHTERTARIDGT
jgi:hypothetical protein